MIPKRLVFHLVQFPSAYGEPLRTLKNLQKMLTRLSIKRGEWVVLPEMWPSSLAKKNLHQQQIENVFCFHWLKSFARDHACYMGGSMLEMPGKKAYNSVFIIDPEGKLLARYRKIHLFRLTGEHTKYQPGRTVRVAPFSWGKLGMAICFDLRFPELFRKMVARDARVILLPSAWPRERMGHFFTLLKARAIENQCFMVGVNKCGMEKEGVVFGGHSMVIDPWGDILGELGGKKGVLKVTLDLSRVDRVRKQYPFLRDRVFS